LEERKESMVMERLDFSTLVEEICKDMALIQEKDITLEYEVEPSVFVKGNGELLTKLLNNLIINAYRYGVQGGHIFVTLTRMAEEVRLSVADDGIGISEEDLEQIWNRFYQADASRGSRGAGLGLPMVEEIAKLHKGRMTVESKIGEGSTFVFHLQS
jgi:signal transduction histidine kinase